MLRVYVHVVAPPKSGKTDLIKVLKTAAVGFTFGRGVDIEIEVTESSIHKTERGIRPKPAPPAAGLADKDPF